MLYGYSLDKMGKRSGGPEEKERKKEEFREGETRGRKGGWRGSFLAPRLVVRTLLCKSWQSFKAMCSQTTIVVSAVECRSLALITQKTACFACAWGSFSLWLTANGCCCCCCVPFASNCWVGVGRRTLREPRLVGMQCRKRNIRCGHHHLVPSLSIRTVGGSACCNCCKQ